tara:strand:- start:4490 stop:5065 length:576 start_codon:yes stop_codon:yes gene_type:complete
MKHLKLISRNPNISESIKPKIEKNNNKFNLLLFGLIIIAILYLYWFYFRDIFSSSLRLPHAYNEDENKLLSKEKDSPVIGMEPKTHQNIHELTEEEKDINHPDFYTVSNLISTDSYFNNNKEIKIKELNDNCKEFYDPKESGIYTDCLKKKKLYGGTEDIVNNEYHNINVYTNERIMNGGEFMNGITGTNI